MSILNAPMKKKSSINRQNQYLNKIKKNLYTKMVDASVNNLIFAPKKNKNIIRKKVTGLIEITCDLF